MYLRWQNERGEDIKVDKWSWKDNEKQHEEREKLERLIDLAFQPWNTYNSHCNTKRKPVSRSGTNRLLANDAYERFLDQLTHKQIVTYEILFWDERETTKNRQTTLGLHFFCCWELQFDKKNLKNSYFKIICENAMVLRVFALLSCWQHFNLTESKINFFSCSGFIFRLPVCPSGIWIECWSAQYSKKLRNAR